MRKSHHLHISRRIGLLSAMTCFSSSSARTQKAGVEEELALLQADLEFASQQQRCLQPPQQALYTLASHPLPRPQPAGVRSTLVLAGGFVSAIICLRSSRRFSLALATTSPCRCAFVDETVSWTLVDAGRDSAPLARREE